MSEPDNKPKRAPRQKDRTRHLLPDTWINPLVKIERNGKLVEISQPVPTNIRELQTIGLVLKVTLRSERDYRPLRAALRETMRRHPKATRRDEMRFDVKVIRSIMTRPGLT